MFAGVKKEGRKREFKFRAWQDSDKVMLYGIEITTAQNSLKIMQFTGLKDTNGIDIYEMDIVNYPFSEAEGNHLVIWDEYQFLPFSMFEDRTLWEVVGNLYETPELLVCKNTK